jgi:TonB family protein
MKRIVLAFVACVLASALFAQQPPDPVLLSAQMPKYPVIARFARVTGDVEAAFTLDDGGNVASVHIVSGPPLLADATQANIKTWKFKMPKNSGGPDREYKTTFTYRFSGREVGGSDEDETPLKLRVTVTSFHEIEIISDTYKPTIQF